MWQPGSEERFANGFEQRLVELGIEFVREGNLEGYRFDYVIRAPSGDVLGVDLKMTNLDSNPPRYVAELGSLRRAIPNSYIVLDFPPFVPLPPGVVVASEFFEFLRDLKKKPRGGIRGDAPIEAISEVDLPLIFAAMPFAPQYSDTYFLCIRTAAKNVDATSKRVDEAPFVGDIVDEVKQYIKNAACVVADLSESKPNVLYEIGYADALRIPVIHICSTPLKGLPFDVGHINTIPYAVGQVGDLIPKLEASLRVALKLPKN